MAVDSCAALNIQMHREIRALTAKLAEIDDRLFQVKEKLWQSNGSGILIAQLSKLQADRANIQSQIHECTTEQKKIEQRLERHPNFLYALFQRFRADRS